jgi:hypothetical protein
MYTTRPHLKLITLSVTTIIFLLQYYSDNNTIGLMIIADY